MSAPNRQGNRQGWDDGDWDDSGGKPPTFHSKDSHLSNRPVKNQGWDCNKGVGSKMGRGNVEGWDAAGWNDGANNTNRTSPGRPQNRDTRDLRNKISGSSGDVDLRNKISGNSRERDLRSRISGSNTSGTNWDSASRNRNDGVAQVLD